jgi:hypothetical protein
MDKQAIFMDQILFQYLMNASPGLDSGRQEHSHTLVDLSSNPLRLQIAIPTLQFLNFISFLSHDQERSQIIKFTS